jgi:hypothetical protein
MKWVMGSLKIKKGAGTHLNLQARARQLLKTKTLGFWANPYCLHSADSKAINARAKTLEEAARPKRSKEHHEALVQTMETQYPHWRQFESLLLVVLPFYLSEYLYGGARPELWTDLFHKCEQRYALLDHLKQSTENACAPSDKRNPMTIIIFYLIRPNGEVVFTSVRDFLNLCNHEYIDDQTANSMRLIDGGSFIEEVDVTGVPYTITEIGPGNMRLPEHLQL